MLVALATVKPVVTTLPLLPLKVTAVAPLRLVPVRLTEVPTVPLGGVKLVMVGAFGVLMNTLRLLVPALATVRSRVPSLSASAAIRPEPLLPGESG
jgi:hypothetical protein